MIRSAAVLLAIAISLSAAFKGGNPLLEHSTSCNTCLKSSPDGHGRANLNVETIYTSSLRDIENAYHDGSFEGTIGCGGQCAFSVRFTADEAIFLTGLTLYTNGGNATNAIISIYLDSDTSIAGPPSSPTGPGDGSEYWESNPIDLSTVGSISQFDVILDSILIPTGDYYVAVWENDSGYLGMANDLQTNYIDRNWVYIDNAWETLDVAAGSDPTLVGNYGISCLSVPVIVEGSFMTVSPQYINFGVLQLTDAAMTQDITIYNHGLVDFEVTSIDISGDDFSTATTPFTIASANSVSMSITFTPSQTGQITGTITINSNADNVNEISVDASAIVYDGYPIYITEIMQNPSAVSCKSSK